MKQHGLNRSVGGVGCRLAAMVVLCVAAIGAPAVAGEARVTIDSAVLGERRPIRVVLPEAHESCAAGYPLIIVLDGEFNTGDASSIASFLERAGSIPPCVLVGIENVERERDMTPPGMRIDWLPVAAGDRFLAFMEKELIPRVSEMVKLSGLRVIVGHSHGGIFGSWAVCSRPDLIQIAVALDAPWHLDDRHLVRGLLQRCADNPGSAVRLVVGETRFSFPDDAWDQLVRTAPADSMLVRFRVDDETHESMSYQGTYRGLKEAFRAYATARPEGATPAGIDEMCGRLSRTLGGRVPPSPGIYADAVSQCLLDARAADARAILERWVADFGRGARTDEILAEIEECAKHGPLAETVSEMVGGPRATSEQIKPYLGRWSGTTRLAAARGRDLDWTVDFSVHDGRAEALIISRLPDGEELRREAVVVRLRSGRLEFGAMNGMRPRGVLLYSVAPDHPDAPERLEGDFQMAGVWFRWPEELGPLRGAVTMRRVAEERR